MMKISTLNLKMYLQSMDIIPFKSPIAMCIVPPTHFMLPMCQTSSNWGSHSTNSTLQEPKEGGQKRNPQCQRRNLDSVDHTKSSTPIKLCTVEGSQSHTPHNVSFPSIKLVIQMWLAYPIHEALATHKGKLIIINIKK